ncbi:ArsR/SmtB family transcription factor [Gluconacetobacter diazotrophicus]|uniref:Helix-turn-helix transcriptional regulator n=1 Tax=Gluconacetobacter diazotrophicus TaxID=33996 RepID=A0A7W4I5V6_GLUDI|nr:metalloregulator ArsR/SmtB family transcription factor [Gluconacetobacter diazotrophicus]MBB2156830.1 helix-turn-helix transcriptional regulator [Gluconacetobacter diazotrophicus]
MEIGSPCQDPVDPSDRELAGALDVLAALAQPSRLAAFRLLVRHEPEGLPAGGIAHRLGVPQNTLSTHLAILARSGLVRATRRSRSIIYRADLSVLRGLVLFLVRDCCGGAPDVCAPLLADLAACRPASET